MLNPIQETTISDTTDFATFAAGCFWCAEAVFQDINGVIDVKPGYMGGSVPNPDYKQVCAGKTGHAEVLRINFDPAKVSFGELLEIFFAAHDPTTLNRQGNDVGTQYRSAIFYRDDEQKRKAETVKADLDKSGVFGEPIVTEIVKESTFYFAENYHQEYFNNNQEQPYCKLTIRPKVDKIRKLFKDKLK